MVILGTSVTAEGDKSHEINSNLLVSHLLSPPKLVNVNDVFFLGKTEFCEMLEICSGICPLQITDMHGIKITDDF